MNNIFSWAGGIGGIIGSVAGILALRDRWKNRKADLQLFAPYYFTGIDATTRKLWLFIMLRISNLSQTKAFLYLETMSIEIMNASQWNKVTWSGFPFLKTDFSSNEKSRFGVDEVKGLHRFGSPIITYDNPLTGYVAVTNDDETILKACEAIRIRVKDCHFHTHKMQVEFGKQRHKHDPTYG